MNLLHPRHAGTIRCFSFYLYFCYARKRNILKIYKCVLPRLQRSFSSAVEDCNEVELYSKDYGLFYGGRTIRMLSPRTSHDTARITDLWSRQRSNKFLQFFSFFATLSSPKFPAPVVILIVHEYFILFVFVFRYILCWLAQCCCRAIESSNLAKAGYMNGDGLFYYYNRWLETDQLHIRLASFRPSSALALVYVMAIRQHQTHVYLFSPFNPFSKTRIANVSCD